MHGQHPATKRKAFGMFGKFGKITQIFCSLHMQTSDNLADNLALACSLQQSQQQSPHEGSVSIDVL